MNAVDTNLLVYAHRKEMPLHSAALIALGGLVSGLAPWAIPWPCIHEFIAVVTNSRIFKTPTPLATAFDTIRSWQQGDNVHFLSEGEGYSETLEKLVKNTALSGAKIHDARIAALCLHHDVSALWSCDRDFSLFPMLRTHNPLV
jgi:toxin-antitoxin system PIN domain toxin